VKKPTQRLPWEVREVRYLNEVEYTVVDADLMWVANFGNVRADADFVVDIANQWHTKRKGRQ